MHPIQSMFGSRLWFSGSVGRSNGAICGSIKSKMAGDSHLGTAAILEWRNPCVSWAFLFTLRGDCADDILFPCGCNPPNCRIGWNHVSVRVRRRMICDLVCHRSMWFVTRPGHHGRDHVRQMSSKLDEKSRRLSHLTDDLSSYPMSVDSQQRCNAR